MGIHRSLAAIGFAVSPGGNALYDEGMEARA
jgi:hypothetical protein